MAVANQQQSKKMRRKRILRRHLAFAFGSSKHHRAARCIWRVLAHTAATHHHHQNKFRQQQQQQQQGAGSSSTHIDQDDLIFDEAEKETSLPNQQGQPHQYDGNVLNKDQMRKAFSSTCSLDTAFARAEPTERGGAATIADTIPIVSALVVRESQRIVAEEQEDRLHDAERRAAESTRRVAEAAQRHQQVRLAQLEREFAAQQSPPPQPIRNIFIRHGDDEDDFDNDEKNKKQQQQQPLVRTVKKLRKERSFPLPNSRHNDNDGAVSWV
jgi:hypothetical protein